jgi:hypothetical protein
MEAAQPRAPTEVRPWWETRWFVAALILISAIPLLYPTVPPLVDLPGHMGRYRVQLDLNNSPWLQQYYDFQWAAIGNLGVDVLVEPLGRLLGLELAVKLIILAIPPMTVAGFLWVAREVHHRVPPTAMFALPFAYCHPFLYGFANFALSMALAFLAFGLWLRLGRLGRVKLRAILFVPISIIVFFAHTFGWGALGLMCFSAEAVRQHDRGRSWLMSGVRAALKASVMALPLLFMILWRTDMPVGMTRNFFMWQLKWEWVYSALRDRWHDFDQASMAVIALLLLFAIVSRHLTLSRNLLFSGLVLLAFYIILPWTIFGSAYADMRLAPYVVVVLVLAIRSRGETHMPTARTMAYLGLAFFLVRTAGTTASMTMAARDHESKLAALEAVPWGARVAVMVGRPCVRPWELPRNSHLGAMVIVRNHGFSNDQWAISGTNLLKVHYPRAGVFQADPSQMVLPNVCGRGRWTVNRALTELPLYAFDYLWLVDVPSYDPSLLEGMQKVWEKDGSAVYRINPYGVQRPRAKPRTASESGR